MLMLVYLTTQEIGTLQGIHFILHFHQAHQTCINLNLSSQSWKKIIYVCIIEEPFKKKIYVPGFCKKFDMVEKFRIFSHIFVDFHDQWTCKKNKWNNKKATIMLLFLLGGITKSPFFHFPVFYLIFFCCHFIKLIFAIIFIKLCEHHGFSTDLAVTGRIIVIYF